MGITDCMMNETFILGIILPNEVEHMMLHKYFSDRYTVLIE